MGISVWQLLIVLVIVLLLFGTKRIRSLGSDLGSAIKSFRTAVSSETEEEDKNEGKPGEDAEHKVIEGNSKHEAGQSEHKDKV